MLGLRIITNDRHSLISLALIKAIEESFIRGNQTCTDFNATLFFPENTLFSTIPGAAATVLLALLMTRPFISYAVAIMKVSPSSLSISTSQLSWLRSKLLCLLSWRSFLWASTKLASASSKVSAVALVPRGLGFLHKMVASEGGRGSAWGKPWSYQTERMSHT